MVRGPNAEALAQPSNRENGSGRLGDRRRNDDGRTGRVPPNVLRRSRREI